MRSRRRSAIFVAVAIAFALVGCELVVDTSGLSGGPGEALEGSTDAPALGDASSTDSGATDAGSAADATPPLTSCPGTKGPTMVLVSGGDAGPSFCVDSLEVTTGQFGDFLDTNPPTSLLPADCSFKTSYNLPTDDSTVPARVDWCDAFAYCKWAGKRLCGKIGGGTNGFADYANADKSQWYAACSNHGATPYPYGKAYVAGRCNDLARDAGEPLAPKTADACQGGVPGAYDMSGNVWEWEDSCRPGDGGAAQDQCRVRGGCWVDEDPVLACDFDYLEHFDPRRGAVDGHVGFRCCADL